MLDEVCEQNTLMIKIFEIFETFHVRNIYSESLEYIG